MRTRALGSSGIKVGEVGLGTWSLSGDGYGPTTPDDARRIVEVALDEGVTFVETADCYAEGRVEQLIGEVLRARGREKAFVSTRVGVVRGEVPRKDFAPKYLRAACEASLRRLQSDHVDALVLHNPLVGTIAKGEAMKCLHELKKEGKARLVGVSVGSVAAGEAAVAMGADLLVVPYNLYFPAVLHRLSGVLSGGHVGVVARSPLGYGLLADTWGANRRFRDEDHRMYRWSAGDLAKRIRQRESVRELLGGDLTTIRNLALRYVLANGLVNVVVPGARVPDHAVENAHAGDAQPYLPEHVLSVIGKHLSAAGIDG